MSYIVSQMRKVINSQKPYMSPVTVIPGTMSSPNILSALTTDPNDDNSTFTDFALKRPEGQFFQRGKVYYVRFKIHRIPRYFYSGNTAIAIWTDADDLTIDLILKNDTDEEKDESLYPPERIATFLVPHTKEMNETDEAEQYISFSYVFTPTKNFNTLGFRVYRVAYDILSENKARNWLTVPPQEADVSIIIGQDSKIDSIRGEEIRTEGPRISYTGDDGEVCELRNIMEEKEWLKFGYQSRPGGLIVVNKEPIRIGRSGIYEINNGTKITSFMIANPGGSNASKIDAFLLDYAYNGEES